MADAAATAARLPAVTVAAASVEIANLLRPLMMSPIEAVRSCARLPITAVAWINERWRTTEQAHT
jgi:hypothetical protein